MNRTIGVVIPAFRPNPSTLNTYIDELQECSADTIHLEIDAPNEETLDAINPPESINVSARRRGKGRALTHGFETLSTDVVAFADADGSTPVSSLEDVIKPVQTGSTDVAIGSRRHPDATIESHQTAARRRMGDVFAWVARRMLPPTAYDYQCGAKAFSMDAWESIQPHITETGFAWDLEVIAIAGALNHSIEEIPVVWDDDPDSTVNPVSTTLSMARALVSIRYRINTIDEADIP